MAVTMTPQRPTTISSPATTTAERLVLAPTELDQMTPPTKTAAQMIARHMRCWRVGAGRLSGAGTRLKTLLPSEGAAELIGAPHPMHTCPLSLTVRPHSLHWMRAMAGPL